MDIEKLLNKNREAIIQIAQKHGACNIRIFGSAVHGRTTKDSDIDFLVDIEHGRSLMDVSRLHIDLTDLLGCKVDVVEPAAVHWYIRDSILKEAVPL